MTTSNGYFEHVTIDSERWDLLAYRYYGDAAKQSVLLEANRKLFTADQGATNDPVIRYQIDCSVD